MSENNAREHVPAVCDGTIIVHEQFWHAQMLRIIFIIHTSYNVIRRHTTSCNVIQRHTTSYNVIQRHTTSCNAMQRHATSCNVIQRHTTSYNVIQRHTTSCNVMQRHATSCNVMQRHATSYNVIQRHTTSYNVIQRHTTFDCSSTFSDWSDSVHEYSQTLAHAYLVFSMFANVFVVSANRTNMPLKKGVGGGGGGQHQNGRIPLENEEHILLWYVLNYLIWNKYVIPRFIPSDAYFVRVLYLKIILLFYILIIEVYD